MEKTFVKGKVNECCEKPENLEPQPSDKPELIIKKCKVCDRKQYRLMAQQGVFGGLFSVNKKGKKWVG